MGESKYPHRRKTDRNLAWKASRIWQRAVPAACIVMAAYAVIGLDGKVDKTQGQLEAQREGRRVALDVLCGGLYGVQEAGRLILLGELPPPAPPTPRITERERGLRLLYAQAYAQVISRRVLDEVQIDAKEVLRDDGTVDCGRLKEVSAAASGGRLPTPTPTESP